MTLSWRMLLSICVIRAGLPSCSGIREDTFEIEVTTDRELHRVELWSEDNGEDKLVYALQFPQSYYVFRDNHHALKQTTIGMLLDTKTGGALTDAIAAETGLRETLDVPRGFEFKLKKAAYGRFGDRQLLIEIRGAPAKTSRLSLERARQRYGTSYKFVGERDGLAVYQDRGAAGTAVVDPSAIIGFVVADPDIQFYCPAKTVFCSVDFPFRNSTLTLYLRPGAMSRLRSSTQNAARLIERHLTK